MLANGAPFRNATSNTLALNTTSPLGTADIAVPLCLILILVIIMIRTFVSITEHMPRKEKHE